MSVELAAGQTYHSEGYQMWVDHVADNAGDPTIELWRFRFEDDPYDGDGYLALTVQEIVQTEKSGTLAVYHRQWVAPDGKPAWGNRKRRVIGSIASLQSLIRRRKMTLQTASRNALRDIGEVG